MRINEVRYTTEHYDYRTPIKFGGVVLDCATLLIAEIDAELPDGKRATGFGSMPLGNVWAWPSKTLKYSDTLNAMLLLAGRVATITHNYRKVGHPIEMNHELEPLYFAAASFLPVPEPIPPLAALVTASPFDAALHDAYGKLHGLNCYRTYGKKFLKEDLGHFLGSDFRGIPVDACITEEPQPSMPLYHLVGALDPLTSCDVKNAVGDGLPESLSQWIPYNGLTHFKIKLNGEDLAWDVDRVLAVNRVCEMEQPKRKVAEWFYSLDFNEKCGNVEYLLEFLRRIEESSPRSFDRVQYIEQPTKRDLKADSANTMHSAAKLKPVVIDEALVDLESLLLARDMGYTGVALKACKGQSQSLLLAGAARHLNMFLCVQDLTCPGASLIQSAGLAAHVRGIMAIEANARQYFPAANEPWRKMFPGIFDISDGTMKTGELTGPGLGAVP